MSSDVDEVTLRVDQVFRDSLGSLDLSNLRLRTLPPRLADVTSLTALNLSDNRLTALPEGLAHLTGLATLDLSGNWLAEGCRSGLPP